MLTEQERDAREGWASAPVELLAIVGVAAALGVARQRVLQMIHEGKLRAVARRHAI